MLGKRDAGDGAHALQVISRTAASRSREDLDKEQQPFLGGRDTANDDGLEEEIDRYLESEDLKDDLDAETGLMPSAPLTTYGAELKAYIGFMLPLLINSVLARYCIALGPVSSMGQFGSTHLAGGALAITTLNVLGVVPVYGITSALNTLSNQAHGGAATGGRRVDLNMLYSLRVLLVAAICMVPLMVLICTIEPILLLLRVEPDAASVTAKFMRIASPGIPAFLVYESIRKYAQAQSLVVGPSVAVVAAALPCVAILHFTTFGVNTAPACLAIFYILSLVFELVWAFYFLPASTWQDLPSFHVVFQDLKVVVKLGIAGTISTCTDWFAWEYLNFASAWLGTRTLSANSVFLATASFMYALPSGLMNGSGVRVGYYLGRNAPQNARIAALTAIAFALAISIPAATFIGFNSVKWTALFTEDPEVVPIVLKVMPCFTMVLALDAIQGINIGILQGAGLPMKVARSMIIFHWFVGIPLATLLAFSGLNMGLLGLWLGFTIGLTLVAGSMGWTIYTNDWEKGARDAQAHLNASEKRARTASSI